MKIVVTCDFTAATDSAVAWAASMARHDAGSEIVLVHVQEKSGSGSLQLSIDQTKRHIQTLASDSATRYAVPVTGEVIEGALNTVLPLRAAELQAQFVVMGTHGISGMQRLFGSKAIKLISGSEVPFLVVQSAPKAGELLFQRLIIPMGVRPEEVEKCSFAAKLAQRYGSHVYISLAPYSDPAFKSRQAGNIALIKRLLSSNGIPFTIEEAQPKLSVVDNCKRVAEKYHCDSMVIAVTQKARGIAAAFNSTDQDLVANAMNLPVFCINSTMSVRW